MSSLNKVQIIGNLGKDPEARSLSNGNEVVNLTVATSESWTDKSTGEKKEKSEWHRIVIFNQHLAKVAKSYLKKGSKVYLEGQLQTRKWTDQAGVEKYSTEIVLSQFKGDLVLLSSAGGAQSAHDAAKADGYAPQQAVASHADDGLDSSEIPF